jgi:hypothetical protein
VPILLTERDKPRIIMIKYLCTHAGRCYTHFVDLHRYLFYLDFACSASLVLWDSVEKFDKIRAI